MNSLVYAGVLLLRCVSESRSGVVLLRLQRGDRDRVFDRRRSPSTRRVNRSRTRDDVPALGRRYRNDVSLRLWPRGLR
jgi:hypothetical protein